MNPKPVVLVDKEATPFVWKALQIVLHDKYDLKDVNENGININGSTDIGLIVWLYGDMCPGFMESLTKLWQEGVRCFVVLCPAAGADRPWDSLPPLQQGALAAAVSVCDQVNSVTLPSVLEGISAPPHWVLDRLQRLTEAVLIYKELLQPFGHNMDKDFSNQFLAPVRLLKKAKVTTPDNLLKSGKEIWNSFARDVVEKARESQYGTLGQELYDTGVPVGEWLCSKNGNACTAADIERLMALLTDCRETCGAHTSTKRQSSHSTGKSGYLPPPASSDRRHVPLTCNGKTAYKILVVDDHAAAWRPVIEVLQKRLKDKSKPAVFEFSIDAWNMLLEDKAFAPVDYGLYDLVILDVFLRAVDGRDILKNRIRPNFPSLPVFLWTTSRDEEVVADASLANGVLLKKTITWDILVDAIDKALPTGRAKAISSLPGPFFNHTICNMEYRKLILDFNEWCLRQCDSFHALDGSYFRYFTDHGGRHIMKVLELMEYALVPFRGDTEPRLLSADPKSREFEITALCLSVVCHELGMFPLGAGTQVEDFSALGDAYLNDVRSLHAVRGMVLLHDKSQRFWSDVPGRKIGVRLHKLKHPERKALSLGDVIALLVGYHSRCLDLNKEENFLQWTGQDRFDKLKCPTPTLSRTSEAFRDILVDLQGKIASSGASELRDRLRRQCALLRFVDAIDMAESRNPAQFLIHNRNRNRGALNNREYLKRQLCKKVHIERGKVSAESWALKPQGNCLKKILAAVATFKLSKVTAGANNNGELDRVLQNPWQRTEGGCPVKGFQKPLDAWLVSTWHVIVGHLSSSAFVQHLQEVKVLGNEATPRITVEGKKLIASLTALSVAGEVLEEYEGIVKCGLDKRLCLSEFKWGEDSQWKDGVPPEMSILAEAIEQYPAGAPDLDGSGAC